MQTLPAPTHSGPSHVVATRGTLAMDCCAMVGAWTTISLCRTTLWIVLSSWWDKEHISYVLFGGRIVLYCIMFNYICIYNYVCRCIVCCHGNIQ